VAATERIAASLASADKQIAQATAELDQERRAHEAAEALALDLGGRLKEALRAHETLERESSLWRLRAEAAALPSEQARAVLCEREEEAQRLKQQVHRLETELRDARSALNSAVRTQALRENDLRELQGRYAAVQREQEASQELLTRLAERLAVAQRYFEKLAMVSGPDTLTADAKAPLVVPTSVAKPKARSPRRPAAGAGAATAQGNVETADAASPGQAPGTSLSSANSRKVSAPRKSRG
jgi:chromosome segregation ATPase